MPDRPAQRPTTTLATSLNWWNRLDSVGRFVLYFRYSMHLIVAGSAFLALAVPFAAGSDDLPIASGSPVAGAAAAAVLLALAAVAIVIVELEPDFNSRPRADVRPWRTAGAASDLAAIAVAVPLYLFGPEPWRMPAGAVFFGAGLLYAGVIAPWVKRRWVHVGLLAALAALVANMLVAAVILFFFTVSALSVWSVKVVKEAERARYLEAALQVSEERLRFAQELHDTLGQHLAAMSVKAELARALARRGDARLDAELTELQKLTQTSMSEMREVVEGYRTINLATEIEGARGLLESAGAQVEVTGDSFDVPEPEREIAAWFLREAATNVLKHSNATHVTVELAPAAVTVVNDGAGEATGPPGGLSALLQRAGAVGSSLSTRRDGNHFTAQLTFPEGDTV